MIHLFTEKYRGSFGSSFFVSVDKYLKGFFMSKSFERFWEDVKQELDEVAYQPPPPQVPGQIRPAGNLKHVPGSQQNDKESGKSSRRVLSNAAKAVSDKLKQKNAQKANDTMAPKKAYKPTNRAAISRPRPAVKGLF